MPSYSSSAVKILFDGMSATSLEKVILTDLQQIFAELRRSLTGAWTGFNGIAPPREEPK